MSIKIEGLDALLRSISQLTNAVQAQEALTAVLEEVAEPIRASAAAKAPLDTGRLRASITVQPLQNKKGEVSIAIGVTGDGFYGRFHEYGTQFIPARPFMRPAFDQHKAATERRIAGLMWDLVEDSVRG